MTPEEADAKQEWKGMDGAIAWQLIERHAESWTEIGEMMHAWLRANQGIGERNLQAFNYAKTLAITIQKKYYPEATQWKPLDDTLGLLTQIDNMISRLVRANQPVIEAQIVDERANNYSRILTILGMEEKGDPVATVEMMHITLRGILEADWRRWDELSSADEFVEWAKSRANHALRYCKNN